mgnify:CR=1 FL=1
MGVVELTRIKRIKRILGVVELTRIKRIKRILGAFKGVHLSQVHQPSKQCTEQMNTISFVGALLALASGKAERRQVHPLEGTHRIRLIRLIRCYFYFSKEYD